MSSAWTKIAVAFFALLLYAQAPEGKRLSVYTAQTGYSLSVVDHDRSEYVGFFEVLEPMGPVSTRLDRKKWRVKFRDIEAEFEDGKTRAKIAGKYFDLADRFFLENNRGMVPLRSLPTLVTALTGITAELRGTSRRLFVGATPVRFSTELRGANTLVFTFSKPVNPFIATEHGAVRMVFARDPLVPTGSDERTFQDAPVSSLLFEEANGAAEITVGVKEPMLARFSDANRTITLTPVEKSPPPSQSSKPPVPSPSTGVPAPSQSGTPPPRRPPFFVLIDPAHGGSDRGAVLSDSLLEKDAVLTIARQLRVEMTAKGIPVKMLRDSDADISTDRRAVAVNTARAAAVIFVHASTVGNGVHVSTAILPATATAPAVWETAQSHSVNLSRQWADAVAAELLKRNIAALRMRASVPPLNQAAVPALVLEVAPPPSAAAKSLFSNSYLQAIMAAVADATAAQRSRLEQGSH